MGELVSIIVMGYVSSKLILTCAQPGMLLKVDEIISRAGGSVKIKYLTKVPLNQPIIDLSKKQSTNGYTTPTTPKSDHYIIEYPQKHEKGLIIHIQATSINIRKPLNIFSFLIQ